MQEALGPSLSDDAADDVDALGALNLESPVFQRPVRPFEEQHDLEHHHLLLPFA